jgi:hypothetical protein
MDLAYSEAQRLSAAFPPVAERARQKADRRAGEREASQASMMSVSVMRISKPDRPT